MQSDVLLGLFEQFTAENEESSSSDESSSSAGSSVQREDAISASVGEAGVVTVVGPTATELESLNELIRFDHVYYKATTSSPETVELSPVAADATSPPPSLQTTSGEAAVSVVKRLKPKPQATTTQQQQQQPQLLLPTITLDDELSQESLARLLDLNSILEEDLLKQNDETLHMPALASPEIAAPDNNTADTTGCIAVSKDTLQVPTDKLQSRKRKRQSSVNGYNLSQNTSLSPRAARLCSDDIMEELSPLYDSFYGSDVSDALSPRSDVTSPLGTDGWEESFTELFPSLV